MLIDALESTVVISSASLATARPNAMVTPMRIVNPLKKRPRRRSGAGGAGDYEAELVRLCRGNRRQADRLIQEEMARSPGVTPAGAALALVTRIRHERDPHLSRL